MSHAEKRKWAAKFRIKYRDVFHLKQFYKTMYEWLRDKEWKDLDENVPNHFETLYLERVDQYNNREYWIWWRLWKFPEEHSNTFFRYRLNIDIHCVYIQDVEIMHEGKKIRCNKGEIEIKILSFLEFDYTGAWSKNKMLAYFRELLQAHILHHTIDDTKKRLYRETYFLQGAIKKYLQLKGFLPELELEQFHPSKAFPSPP